MCYDLIPPLLTLYPTLSSLINYDVSELGT